MPWLVASGKCGWRTKEVAEGRPGGRGAWETGKEVMRGASSCVLSHSQRE